MKWRCNCDARKTFDLQRVCGELREQIAITSVGHRQRERYLRHAPCQSLGCLGLQGAVVRASLRVSSLSACVRDWGRHLCRAAVDLFRKVRKPAIPHHGVCKDVPQDEAFTICAEGP